MSSQKRTLAMLALFLTLLTMGHSSKLTYSYPALTTSPYENPAYPIGAFATNDTMTVRVLLVNQYTPTVVADLDVKLYDQINKNPIAGFPTTSVCVVGNWDCTFTFTVTAAVAGSYYLEVAQKSASSTVEDNFVDRFQLTVSKNSLVVFRATDTIRSLVHKYIYFNSARSVNFTISNVNDSTILYLQLRQMTAPTDPTNFNVNPTLVALTQLTFAKGPNGVANEPGSKFTNIDYSADVVVGFYWLKVYTDATQYSRIIISYLTDPYLCPYDPSFPDFYGNFLGCNFAASQPGLPCATYNTVTGQCTNCIPTYVLISGKCYSNFTCGPRQYIDFEQCFNVSDTCATFDVFTGFCLTCIDKTYALNANGTCNKIIPTCGARQFIKNYLCVDVSPSCNTFDVNTGFCLTCVNSTYFEVDSGECVLIIHICDNGEYYSYSQAACVIIPTECFNFDVVLEKCGTCIQGFFVDQGVCKRIVCPPNQVPSRYGPFCVAVSAACNIYDTVSGKCLSCKEPTAVVTANGDCAVVISPLAGCMDRQKLGYGPCVGAQNNCKTYNLLTGNCDLCNDGFILDYQGLCTLVVKCQDPRTWNVNNECLPIPVNCLAVDQKTGFCTRCVSGDYTIQSGICVKIIKCGSQQYLSGSGQCIDVSAACNLFNPTTGLCITCVIAGTFPTEGICCPAGQVSNNQICVDTATLTKTQSEATTVQCTQHPSLGYCISCPKGYHVEPVLRQTCVK